jgi:plasmid stability protein
MSDFRLRGLPDHWHQAARIAATREGVSLNQWFVKAIFRALEAAEARDPVVRAAIRESVRDNKKREG